MIKHWSRALGMTRIVRLVFIQKFLFELGTSPFAVNCLLFSVGILLRNFCAPGSHATFHLFNFLNVILTTFKPLWGVFFRLERTLKIFFDKSFFFKKNANYEIKHLPSGKKNLLNGVLWRPLILKIGHLAYAWNVCFTIFTTPL